MIWLSFVDAVRWLDYCACSIWQKARRKKNRQNVRSFETRENLDFSSSEIFSIALGLLAVPMKYRGQFREMRGLNPKNSTRLWQNQTNSRLIYWSETSSELCWRKVENTLLEYEIFYKVRPTTWEFAGEFGTNRKESWALGWREPADGDLCQWSLPWVIPAIFRTRSRSPDRARTCLFWGAKYSLLDPYHGIWSQMRKSLSSKRREKCSGPTSILWISGNVPECCAAV